jgi:hypothetical protein
MSEFVSIALTKENQQRFDYALSDIMCWLDGFIAAGGKYAPDTQEVLRDLHGVIKRAYDTLPPVENKWSGNRARVVRNLTLQSIGAKPTVAQQKLKQIRKIAEAIIDEENRGQQ